MILCSSCKGTCSGHYSTRLVNTADSEMMKSVVTPPSVILKQMFSDGSNGQVTDEFMCNAAKKILLTTEEVRIWLDHLSQVVRNRKRGAAITRQKESNFVDNASVSKNSSATNDEQNQDKVCHCTKCGVDYYDDCGQFWIV